MESIEQSTDLRQAVATRAARIEGLFAFKHEDYA